MAADEPLSIKTLKRYSVAMSSLPPPSPEGDVMSNLSKRATIYFDPDIHQALKLKGASAQIPVSELVDEAVRLLLAEDQEDLAAFSERAKEKTLSYEDLLNDLKAHGKI